MIKIFILGILLIFGFVACGCISSQQPIIAVNSSINRTTYIPAPTAALSEVKSNLASVSPTLSPERDSYQKGLALYNEKKYQEAIYAFNTTISLNNTNREAYLARGKAFYQIGRMKIYEVRGDEEFDQAINDFSRSLTYGVNKSEILTFRGWSYYWKGYNNYLRHKDGKVAKASFPVFESAITDFSRVLNDNPDSIDALNGRALAYLTVGIGSDELEYQYDNQKSDLARKDAKRAYDLDPKNPWTNYALFRIAIDLDKEPTEEQIKWLDAAILYDPNESLFYLLRGIRKGITKDYDGSFDDINKAVELQPRSAYAYNQQAILYLDQEKYDEGLVASQKALEINPNIGFHWYIFAYLQWYFLEPVTATGMDEVIKSIDRAIAMDPESARYHWARWRMLVSANRFEEAREEVKIFKGLITTDLDKEKARDMDLDYWYQYDNTIIRYA